ncbi:MAG: DNA translocase FtsK [Planctomycetes bacterium]|nr:DNA translocase FtsK [Planctomycetota bacterium]
MATDADLRDLQNVVDMEGYRFPGLDLLEQPEENFSATLEELVREQAEALERALRQYRIKGEVVGIESGPVITLYDVRLAPGTKVSQVTAVSSDIARALKAVNIRIVPNQVGRDTVGVEVPNPTKEKVRLKELMSRSEVSKKMKLPMFLGKDASGEPLITDLTRMPHMLIAGTTGSGKSVCMSTIIMGFMYTKKPNELKLVLVDPKMVEMSQFKSIPHLMCPVVTEMTKAAAILEWACRKMDERYELLAEAGCRDIAAYNDLGWEDLRERFDPQSPEEEALIPRTLPYMVFIIDELADIMMTVKEAENSIIRIAQKARAVGIHLILATQRPQANVVTGLIKSNMPCRICFKVSSGMDSRIVLDQKGGELLLGQGDMLYLSPHSHKLIRAQGTLVDDPEIRRVVRFMREVASPSFERQLMQLRAGTPDDDRILASENNSSASLQAAQEDAMFNRAVEIVIETGRGSVSLLQRRLAIGYTRASRLIDLMGIAGIIGEHKGSVAREVLIGAEMWSAMQEQAASDAAEGRLPGQEGQGDLFGASGNAESALSEEGLGEGVNVGAPSADDVADDLEEIDDAEDADDDEEDSEALAEFDSEEEDEEDDEEEDEDEEPDEVEYEEAAEYEDEYEDELEEDDAEPVRKPER